MADIFISHSGKDNELAAAIGERIRRLERKNSHAQGAGAPLASARVASSRHILPDPAKRGSLSPQQIGLQLELRSVGMGRHTTRQGEALAQW